MIVSEAAAQVINNKIYLFGGFNHSRTEEFGRNEILTFDVDLSKWEVHENKLLSHRRMHQAVDINNKVSLMYSYVSFTIVSFTVCSI